MNDINDPFKWMAFCIKHKVMVAQHAYPDLGYVLTLKLRKKDWAADYERLLEDAALGVPRACKLLFKFKAGL